MGDAGRGRTDIAVPRACARARACDSLFRIAQPRRRRRSRCGARRPFFSPRTVRADRARLVADEAVRPRRAAHADREVRRRHRPRRARRAGGQRASRRNSPVGARLARRCRRVEERSRAARLRVDAADQRERRHQRQRQRQHAGTSGRASHDRRCNWDKAIEGDGTRRRDGSY